MIGSNLCGRFKGSARTRKSEPTLSLRVFDDPLRAAFVAPNGFDGRTQQADRATALLEKVRGALVELAQRHAAHAHAAGSRGIEKSSRITLAA